MHKTTLICLFGLLVKLGLAQNPINAISVAMDSRGDIYFADYENNQIFKIDNKTNKVTVVVGTGKQGFGGDGGPAVNAKLNHPEEIVIDKDDNLYIADWGNDRIRKVHVGSQTIITVAGNGNYGYSGDGGAANKAMLAHPYGLTIDANGNLFIADTFNHRIRKVDTATGIISTVAGNGKIGYAGDNNVAVNAKLNFPMAVIADSFGNLYIADSKNYCVRKVDVLSEVIETIAGNGTMGYSGDEGAAADAQLSQIYGLASDSKGNLYLADQGNHCVRKIDKNTEVISTAVGTGITGFNGDQLPAKETQLNLPVGLTFDARDNLYITDTENHKIRKVDARTNLVSSLDINYSNLPTLVVDKKTSAKDSIWVQPGTESTKIKSNTSVGSDKSYNSIIDIGADFGVAIPLGDFAKNLNYTLGWNLNVFGYLRLKQGLPFYIGLEWGISQYGQTDRGIDSLYAPVSYPYLDKIRTTFSYTHFHGILRVKSNSNHKVIVYGELFVGERTFNTEAFFLKSTYTTTYSRSNGSTTSSRTQDKTKVWSESSTILSYGLGAGIAWRLFSDFMKIHLEARYLTGGVVRYLDPNSADQAITTNYYGGSNLQFIVDTSKFSRSTPDVLLLNLGMTFMF